MKVKLGDIFDIGSGGTPLKTHSEYYGGSIPWVKTGDLKSAYLYDVGESITEEGLNNSSAKLYEPDTVLVAMYGATIGATAILKIPACTNQACAAFRPYNKVKPEFLYYFLRSKKNKFINDGVGGAQPNISIGYLKNVEMELPELDEQNEIVYVLNKVSAVINKRKHELLKLDVLIKARFVEMFGDPVLNPFGWEQVTLKDVAVGKLSYGSGTSATDYDGECRYIRITDITDNGELNSDIKSPEKYDEKYHLHDGDILFARSGATVGKTFRYSTEKHGKGVYAGYLIRLIPNQKKVLPDYVFYYTKTEYYASFVKKAQRAVAQPNINAQEYGDLIICVPPINLQKEFMEFVKQVDKSKFVVQKALDQAQLLFESLMQKYFG